MKLTLYTDYALRTLIYLAIKRDGPSRVADIAESYGISRNHLLKVALKLGRLGYVTTVRGRSGGISLAKTPEEINLGQVVRQMEDGIFLVECMRTDGRSCAISPACRLKDVIARALEAFLSVLDAYSLADIAGNKEMLGQLLGLSSRDKQPV